MLEKRKLQRFDLKIPAKVEYLSRNSDGNVLDLMTSNLCSGGAYIATNQPLPEGTKVKVDLELPLGGIKRVIWEYDYADIRVTGIVIRRESVGMAISFNKDYSIRPRKGNGNIQRFQKSGEVL
ncbi:MAG: hypothetical protein C4576_12530 [Desulfobacteraceae bacterium]|nr:MAG: hypothetical protein C4576_12530 [Desulfobacteraceae bacterium]